MRHPACWLPLCLLLPAACSGDPSLAAATACLHRFSAALAAGDRAGVRACLTRASRPYLGLLPGARPGAARPLRVLGGRRDHGRCFLRVRDDNPGAPAREGTYVVAREQGVWRIDLIETAGANSHEEALPGPPTRVVPAEVSGRDLRRATRAVEANHRRRRQ